VRVLVAAHAVAATGLLARILWYAGRTLHNLVALVT
jgi:hypothetical protein